MTCGGKLLTIAQAFLPLSKIEEKACNLLSNKLRSHLLSIPINSQKLFAWLV